MISELVTIAGTLYAEAAGEPWEGKVAVASVAWTEHRRTGKPIATVVQNVRRYHGADKPIVIRNRLDLRAWQECMSLAVRIRQGRFRPTGEWTHYFNPETATHKIWMDRLDDVRQIGNHRFGTERKAIR